MRQIDVSNATGIDQKTLSNYETGKTRPDSDALILLADFFDVSIDYLVGRSDNASNLKNEITTEMEKIQHQLVHVKIFKKNNFLQSKSYVLLTYGSFF